ncbi:MAG: EamA family transporter [Anaerolineales bacterium]|nr:EamA family transporter [Anaerolineales bacterium]
MRTIGILAGLTAAGIWGGMYVVSKIVLDVIPPFLLVSVRLVLGSAFLAIFLLLKGGFKATRRQWFQALIVGLIGYGISVGFQFIGTRLSTASNAALVTSASPTFIFLFAAWLLKERATWSRVLALVLASLGVIAVIDPRNASMERALFLGNMALLVAAVTWGLYSVLVKRVSNELSTLEVSVIVFLGGLPISVPLAIAEITQTGMGQITMPIVLGVLYLGLVSTALAMYLWNKSLALLDAGLVSLLFFAQPIVGVGLGAWLLREKLELGFWIGAVLIALGLVISARSGSSFARSEVQV